jgi:hypothetical protein
VRVIFAQLPYCHVWLPFASKKVLAVDWHYLLMPQFSGTAFMVIFLASFDEFVFILFCFYGNFLSL